MALLKSIHLKIRTHTHTHTLAQNGDYELGSGMYHTCKKQLSHLKGLDRVFGGNLMLVLNVG